MNSPTLVLSNTAAQGAKQSSYPGLRACCWTVALALGAAQAWATRFTMNPDGISYLDIGDAYWRHDWHNAINAYWSPLYSWVLGFFINVIKPSPYWEYPLVHLVNFLIYVAALACFEFFIAACVRQHCEKRSTALSGDTIAIPSWGLWLVGYSIFVSSSLSLITLSVVTPDLCVFALSFLAFGLLHRLQSGERFGSGFLLFGVVLGIGYLAKAVIFPLSLAFFISAFLSTRHCRTHNRDTVLAVIAFALLCIPFVAAISLQKNRVTFGDTGKITYSIFLNDVPIFTPEGRGLRHPPRMLLRDPTAHEFRDPIGGTYPLWFDPSYWHEGVKPHFNLLKEGLILIFAIGGYLKIIGSIFEQLNLTVSLFLLYFLAPKPSHSVRDAFKHWRILIPAWAAIAAYAFVYMEPRYVASFVAVLWLSAFAGASLPYSKPMKKLLAAVAIGVAITTTGSLSLRLARSRSGEIPEYVRAAEGLSKMGAGEHTKLAVISYMPYEKGGAFVARLIRARIVAQKVEYDKSLWGNKVQQRELLSAFRQSGADVVLTDDNIGSPEPCWHQVGRTEYSICKLDLAH